MASSALGPANDLTSVKSRRPSKLQVLDGTPSLKLGPVSPPLKNLLALFKDI